MAKVTILVVDTEEGVRVTTSSEPPFPDDFEEFSPAQEVAALAFARSADEGDSDE